MALLSGCATLSPPAPVPVPALAAIPPAFELIGRISIRVGDRGDQARLRWEHRPATDAWIISSPFGNEVARIESGPEGAELKSPGQPPERAASFSALTFKLVGAALEPAQMAGWLHGSVPAVVPGGWNVTIEESTKAGTVDLAKRMTASRGDVVVKLLVDSYRVLPE